MKIKAFLCIVATIVLLTGCGSSKSNSEEKNTTSTEVTQPSEATADSSKTAAATPVPEKKLSESEKLALDYVEIFLNGSDIEAKKKFVSENILPDVQPIFQMAESNVTPENNKLKNASVIESADYTDKDGGKDKIVLIQGEKSSSSSELIVFIKDD